MNHAQAPNEAGVFVLEPGRFYRAVFEIEGRTSVEDFEDALTRGGFDRATLCASAPADWKRERPPDWPVEAPHKIPATNSLVRVSGVFHGDRTEAVEIAIGDDASGRLLALYVYEPEGGWPQHAAGEAPQQKKKLFGDAGLALISGGVLLGLGLWASHRRQERLEQETRRLFGEAEQTDRAEAIAAAEQMEAAGVSPELAHGMTERMAHERAIERELALEGVDLKGDG